MKSKLSILIFLLLTIQLYGQSDTSFYKNQIKFSPLRIVDIINPGLELSYERHYLKVLSSQISAAYMTNAHLAFTPYKYLNGYRLSFEEKIFWEGKNAKKGFGRNSIQYFSGEFVYYKTILKSVASFGDEFPWLDTTGNNNNYLDSFSAKKMMLIYNLKWGVQIQLRHFVFDLGTGIGLKYKDVQHFDRINPNDKMERNRHPVSAFNPLIEGKYYTINFPFNIKIGYCF